MDGAALTRNAAIALAGAHPIMLTGSETADPAKAVALAMTAALPPLTDRELAELQQPGQEPSHRRRRTDRTPPCVHAKPGDPILPSKEKRAGLAEKAHHGTLSAANVHLWTLEPLVELYVAAYRGVARDRTTGSTIRCRCRVTGDWPGCACRDSAQRCTCTDQDRKTADKTLWTDAARWLFDIECEGIDRDETIDIDALRDTNRKARIFRLRTRDQNEPNAIVQPEPGRRGWQLTRAASKLRAEIQENPPDRYRTLQLARTIADIDQQGRINDTHMAEAEKLNRHLRRHGTMY